MTEQPRKTLEVLSQQARTVSAENIHGPVRIISASEIQGLVDQAIQERLASEQKNQRLNEEHQTELNRLQQRISELETGLGEAEQDKTRAVTEARESANKRIAELEDLLKNDSDRARLDFLEQEVVRLQALVDRYANGLEFITTIENPDITEDLETITSLSERANGDLHIRMTIIQRQLEHGKRAIEEGLDAINKEGKGWVYGVTDLLEHSVRCTQLRQEVLSIRQALGA